MKNFLSRFESLITGVLSGFDRLVFRGNLIPFHLPHGMFRHLDRAGIRLLDFKDYAVQTSENVKEAALAEARQGGRPVRYLESSDISKEDLARTLLDENPTDSGIVCALTAVEPCMSFEYHRSQDENERGFRLRQRKCLFVYQYRLHPRVGFMNARIQTWFPFAVQVCLNGREWLSRQLDEAKIAYIRHDNCFPWI
jgi:hypothetical protein